MFGFSISGKCDLVMNKRARIYKQDVKKLRRKHAKRPKRKPKKRASVPKRQLKKRQSRLRLRSPVTMTMITTTMTMMTTTNSRRRRRSSSLCIPRSMQACHRSVHWPRKARRRLRRAPVPKRRLPQRLPPTLFLRLVRQARMLLARKNPLLQQLLRRSRPQLTLTHRTCWAKAGRTW